MKKENLAMAKTQKLVFFRRVGGQMQDSEF